MKTIGVVTVARSDYGLYVPILRRIQQDPQLKLQVWVSGSHLAEEFGNTVQEIERDGWEIVERLSTLSAGDSPEAIGTSIGQGVSAFAQAFTRRRPDLLLVLGDRFDMLPAALAALPHNIPVAHVHGGELTAGAIDDALRHALTKLSHLHFVASEDAARRVLQLGEEPWRVTLSGSPALDRLHEVKPAPLENLERTVGLSLQEPFLLVTYHPVTLAYEQTLAQIRDVTAALEASGLQVVMTYSNADTASHVIRESIEALAARCPRVKVVRHLGSETYLSLMARAAAVVGNSSSGLIEAPTLRVPTVNIGSRQAGRLRANSVIDVECQRAAILAGIQQAGSETFRASLADVTNPYGDGHAAPRIVKRLATISLDERLLMKSFHDVPMPERSETAVTAGVR